MLSAYGERFAMLRLFGYETEGKGRNSTLWTQPDIFLRESGQGAKMLDEAFEQWSRTKRPITKEEVIQGSWVKIGDHGYQFIAFFKEDGIVWERHLSSREGSGWKGTWSIEESMLKMTVEPYSLYIVANNAGVIHSGVEFQEGKQEPNAYFSILHFPCSPVN